MTDGERYELEQFLSGVYNTSDSDDVVLAKALAKIIKLMGIAS